MLDIGKEQEGVMPRAYHIEDDRDWREIVQRTLETVGHPGPIVYRGAETLRDILSEVSAEQNPAIVIIDLRLGGDVPNFLGYHWLLEEFESFRLRCGHSGVFVVSGQLHEGMIDSLVRRGLPRERIFDKGAWTEREHEFIEEVKSALMQEPRTPRRRVDACVEHAFESIGRRFGRADVCASESSSIDAVRLPILVETESEEWQPTTKDVTIVGRIGLIYMCLAGRPALDALRADPAVVGVEASRSANPPDVDVSLPFVRVDLARANSRETGDEAIVGIVDDGIDVLHEAFLDGMGQSRIVGIWDQTDPSGVPPMGFTIGTEHTADNIAQYVSSGRVPDALASHVGEHGTHVASIATGRRHESFAGGVAPGAKLLVVIPDIQVEVGDPNSLGYSVSHLAALAYLKGKAQSLGLPIVINLSVGMNAGAHDGSSKLERGIDAISSNGGAPGVVVVKSAGNESNKSGHASLGIAGFAIETFEWEALTAHRQHIVELWFSSGDDLRFQLHDPNGETSTHVDWSRLDDSAQLTSGNWYYMTLERHHSDNGDARLVVTVDRGVSRSVALGVWSLRVESGRVTSARRTVDAWIERDSDRAVVFRTHIDCGKTLSVPGTARCVITVGAVSSTVPVQLANYSSHGPTRDGREKPDLTAPGERIRAAGPQESGGLAVLSGTSMAAPHVAGAVALLLSRRRKKCRQDPASTLQFNTVQVLAALVQTSRNFTGSWHPGIGYGVLDVDAFLARLG